MPAGGRELGTRPHLPPGNALEVLAQEVAVLLSVGGAYGHEIPGRQDARVTIVALARIEHQHPSAPPPPISVAAAIPPAPPAPTTTKSSMLPRPSARSCARPC